MHRLDQRRAPPQETCSKSPLFKTATMTTAAGSAGAARAAETGTRSASTPRSGGKWRGVAGVRGNPCRGKNAKFAL